MSFVASWTDIRTFLIMVASFDRNSEERIDRSGYAYFEGCSPVDNHTRSYSPTHDNEGSGVHGQTRQFENQQPAIGMSDGVRAHAIAHE